MNPMNTFGIREKCNCLVVQQTKDWFHLVAAKWIYSVALPTTLIGYASLPSLQSISFAYSTRTFCIIMNVNRFSHHMNKCVIRYIFICFSFAWTNSCHKKTSLRPMRVFIGNKQDRAHCLHTHTIRISASVQLHLSRWPCQLSTTDAAASIQLAMVKRHQNFVILQNKY